MLSEKGKKKREYPTLLIAAFKSVHSKSSQLVKKFPMGRILMLADIESMGYKLSCCGSLGSIRTFYLNL